MSEHRTTMAGWFRKEAHMSGGSTITLADMAEEGAERYIGLLGAFFKHKEVDGITVSHSVGADGHIDITLNAPNNVVLNTLYELFPNRPINRHSKSQLKTGIHGMHEDKVTVFICPLPGVVPTSRLLVAPAL